MGYYDNSHVSWSKMRKVLEKDNICESLKGRIQYFQTWYGSHSHTRIAIRIDKKEVFRSSFYHYWKDVLALAQANKRETGNFNYAKAHEETQNQGKDDSFFQSFHKYHNQSIEKSLNDPNPFVRLFAIMDKRVGKRRLQKLICEVKKQPDWLQQFYQLRLDADGIGTKKLMIKEIRKNENI